MRVEISYRMVATIEGDTMEEIRSKWESLGISDYDKRLEFVEMTDVRDAETFDDLTEEFCNTY